jgi:hypothetical protein
MNTARSTWEWYLRRSEQLKDVNEARRLLQSLNALLDRYAIGAAHTRGAAPPSDEITDDQGAKVEDLPFEPGDVSSATSAFDSALARLFVRLGPPPEPSGLDYAPMGSGDGGVQQ